MMPALRNDTPRIATDSTRLRRSGPLAKRAIGMEQVPSVRTGGFRETLLRSFRSASVGRLVGSCRPVFVNGVEQDYSPRHWLPAVLKQSIETRNLSDVAKTAGVRQRCGIGPRDESVESSTPAASPPQTPRGVFRNERNYDPPLPRPTPRSRTPVPTPRLVFLQFSSGVLRKRIHCSGATESIGHRDGV